MITLDFETTGIKGNPLVPGLTPKPVGVAVWVDGHEPVYLSWGHPTGNNTTWAEGRAYVQKLLTSKEKILFHNAPFDLAVADYSMGIPWKFGEWERFHDTTYLVFLDDPYADTLSLKPSAARYLGLAHDEQDDLKRWILEHVPGATEKDFGAYISRAPGELVGAYAIGDVVRTRKLFDLLHTRIVERGMQPAYDRERELMPIMYESSGRGIRVDKEKLDWHASQYEKCLVITDNLIRTRLNAPSLDFGKRGQLAEALETSGYVTEWTLTATGKKSTSKKNLRINNPEIDNLIRYRGALNTCVSTFLKPWVELSARDGRLHTQWNQVKSYEKDNPTGTKTGRMSSNGPNFQNVPTEFTGIGTPEGLLPLPYMRQYLMPEDGHVWLKRDFSSQEVRILAHFEDGELRHEYTSNPNFDPHEIARLRLLERGFDRLRKHVKIVGFSIIYGSGVTGLMSQLGSDDYEDVKALKDAYLDAMPGVRALARDVSAVGRSGNPIRTWGGRVYYSEPAKVIDGRMRSFEYKLLNYLIQGSAADQTKQALIDWNKIKGWETVFLATVHDEINISAPRDAVEVAMARLREEMNKDRFDVPFKSEGFAGPNWHDIEEFEP